MIPVSRISAVVLRAVLVHAVNQGYALLHSGIYINNLRLLSECRSLGVDGQEMLSLDGSALVDGVTLLLILLTPSFDVLPVLTCSAVGKRPRVLTVTFMMRPRVAGPTGIVMGAPVSLALAPRVRPSVPSYVIVQLISDVPIPR